MRKDGDGALAVVTEMHGCGELQGGIFYVARLVEACSQGELRELVSSRGRRVLTRFGPGDLESATFTVIDEQGDRSGKRACPYHDSMEAARHERMRGKKKGGR